MANTLLIESQYLPPIASIARMVHHQDVLLEQHEYYIKSSYRNRSHIGTANGMLRLSVPLVRGRRERQSIKNIKISYPDNKWVYLHWRGICYAYRSSPYFEYYEDEFAPFFEKKFTYLWDYNEQLLQTILGCLGANVNIGYTDSFQKKYNDTAFTDYRSAILPKLEHCRQDDLFTHPKYTQVFEDKIGFIPNLSILDLLFAEGPRSLDILQKSIQ
ncbi:MAG: WbqC family protein [Chitinophagales bacterium]